jgi:hypothetical protein
MSTEIVFPLAGRFPTEKANGYQTAHMAKEFSGLGVSVTVLSAYQKNPVGLDVLSWYKNFSATYMHTVLGKRQFLYASYLPALVSFYVQQIYFSLLFLQFLRTHKHSVVLTRQPWLGYFAHLLGVSVFYECHDWFGKKRRLSLWMCTHFNGIITTNTFIYNEFVGAGFAAAALLCAPNGVSAEVFDIDVTKSDAIKEIPVEERFRSVLLNKKVLLYTGSYKTMGVDKGISDILQSLKMLPDEYVFVAVGGSEGDIKFYSDLAKEQGVAERVYLLGRYSQDELALFQKVADVLLMPFPDKAHYRLHMSPLKSYEYMLSRRPIVVSKLPSLAEVFPPEGVYWCEPDSPVSIREAIEAVFAAGDKAQAVAEVTYETGKQNTWKKRAEKILAFMQSRVAKS